MSSIADGDKPSSPRWFLFPGRQGRGFFIPRVLAPVLILSASLSACSGVSVSDYAGNAPRLVPQDFFAGSLTAHGVVKDFSGKVIRRFNADIKGCWQDGVGTLDEAFVFDDGEAQSRIWTLEPDGNLAFTATAGDVVGEGRATFAGNSMFLDYVLRVPRGDGSIDLSIDDRMYLVSDTVLINESKMRKFGFGVGEILLTIIKRDDAPVTCRQG